MTTPHMLQTRDWRCEPEAARLLADCARRPPSQRIVEYRFQETAVRYSGERVRKLAEIYLAAEPPIDTTEWRCWLTLTPQRAIAEAVRAVGQKELAA